MKKIFLSFFVFLFLINLVFAQPPFQESAQDRGLRVLVSVREYHQVNTSYQENLAVFNTTTGLIINNDTVSCDYYLHNNDDGELIYTNNFQYNTSSRFFYLDVSGGNYSRLGEYIVGMYCNTSLEGGFVEYNFKVIKTNSNLEIPQAIVYSFFMIGIMFSFLLCLYGAFKIPFRDNRSSEDGHIISVNDLKYLKIVCIVFSYLLLMFFFGITRSILYNYLDINGAYKVFNWLFWIMFSFVWPLIVISILLALIYYIDGKKLKKALMRGVPIR